uniref:NET domain-containing protein n=1 Tax=viral metagenome TaxID=1070528 RepID=A0A6C0CUJ2_9ZZZZ
MTDFFCVEENISDPLNGSYMLNPEETIYNLNLDSVENDNDVDDDEEPFNVQELNSIREKIESMPKFNQIEVLRILSGYKNITLNENKYGVLINMTDLKKEVIEKLKEYISYVNTQESNLNELESRIQEYKNIYFVKDNKDKHVKENSKTNKHKNV